ncbi:MAG: serine acetyltransferase [Deltaproteobacteria bacterium]|nr:MAG: serine acetyltransferase [Deltaproteobacteria bacterium]
MGTHASHRRSAPDSEALVDALLASYRTSSGAMEHVSSYELPSMDEVARVLDQARALIFPGFVGPGLVRATETELRDYVRERVESLRRTLRRQVYRGLHHKSQLERGTQDLDCPECAERADVITEAFLGELVGLRQQLALDVQAHYEGDPAATGTDEVVFCYPGLYAISVYRIAHALLDLGAKIIPRMMTELAHSRTGIDIHPGARIGRSFFIDHGTGVVIGETTVIGDRVRIYQGVTIGALSVPRGAGRPTGKRHPTIEDDVVIYSGATILGGNTVIGAGAVIGGNCWVTSSVPPGARVTLAGVEPARP